MSLKHLIMCGHAIYLIRQLFDHLIIMNILVYKLFVLLGLRHAKISIMSSIFYFLGAGGAGKAPLLF